MQKAALAELDRLIQRFHGVLLIRSDLALLALAQIIIGNGDRSQRLALLAQVDKSLQIAPGIERIDEASVVVGVVPEIDQFAIGEEDKWCAYTLGIGQGLLLGDIGVNGGAFGFDDGEGAPVLRQQDIICAPCRNFVSAAGNDRPIDASSFCGQVASMKGVDGNFREDHRLVSGVPERLTEQIIDEDSGVGFSRIILHGQPTTCLALLCRSGMTFLPLQSVVFCTMHCGEQVMCHWPKILRSTCESSKLPPQRRISMNCYLKPWLNRFQLRLKSPSLLRRNLWTA